MEVVKNLFLTILVPIFSIQNYTGIDIGTNNIIFLVIYRIFQINALSIFA